VNETPPVYWIAGEDAVRARVFARKLAQHARAQNATVTWFEGAEGDLAVERAYSTAGVLFAQDQWIFVTDAEKFSADVVRAHATTDTNPSLVVVLISSTLKVASLEALVPPSARKSFALPPFYKMDEHAAGWAVEWAHGRGVQMDSATANALIRHVGHDLGYVAFEVDKAAALARARGSTKIDLPILRGSVAALAAEDGTAVVEALSARTARPLAEALATYGARARGEPTVELCGRVISPAVMRWFQAAALDSNGVSPSAAAGRCGANPWYWEHKVLPAARRWGVGGCGALLRVIATAQRAAFAGSISPWGVLMAGLLRVVEEP
jgi:DNA polymerase III delta subunit